QGGVNYLGESDDTAVSQLQIWFDSAVSSYVSNKSDAYHSLGKAVHYMQDLENHYHSSSMIDYRMAEVGVAHDSDHSEYEKWANGQISLDRNAFTETTVTFDWTGTVSDLGINAAERSNIPFGDPRWKEHKAEHWYNADYWYLKEDNNPKPYIDDLKSFIKQSERDGARIIYMFWQSISA
ncbi:MAG: phospholipase C/P1 nuclease family protein, partial [Eubacteriales bacterium]